MADSPAPEPLSPHEQLGILASRLLHDLANHASAFYGFSAILADETPATSDLAPIVTQFSGSAQRFGECLDEFAAWKQQLVPRIPPLPVATLREECSAALRGSEWHVDPCPPSLGALNVPLLPRWMAHLARSVTSRARTGGRVHFRGAVLGEGRTPHDLDAVVIEFIFAGDPGLDVRWWFRDSAKDLPLAVSREIVRRISASAAIQLPPSGSPPILRLTFSLSR